FAVHSMKDLNADMDPQFTIAAVPEREDPRDALISKDHLKLADLAKGAIIATSSARRSAQIKAIRPDLETQWIRGPIDSRIEQLNADMDPQFIIAAVPEREDPRVAIISKDQLKLADLAKGAIIGTSSARRSAQIKAIRPDLETQWIRGPNDSRIEQLNNGNFDAIVLAVAGLNRMNLSDEVITEYLEIDEFVPSVAQGALAIQCRADDEEMVQILRGINNPIAEATIRAERYTLSLLDE